MDWRSRRVLSWRSVKYEEVYPKAHGSLAATRTSSGRYFARYSIEGGINRLIDKPCTARAMNQLTGRRLDPGKHLLHCPVSGAPSSP